MGWSVILLLLGAADRWLNRTHPLQPKLGEAVFPCYIIHQTIIVMTGFWLRPYALPAGLEFAIMFLATAIGCFAFYEVGRRIGWLRPFIGLSPEPGRRVNAVRPATADA
jgi:membrane protein DedA with SNARE-associated domain